MGSYFSIISKQVIRKLLSGKDANIGCCSGHKRAPKRGGKVREDGKRPPQDKKSSYCGFSCRSYPSSSCLALPNFLEERVMYVLVGKLAPISIFWNHKCNDSEVCSFKKETGFDFLTKYFLSFVFPLSFLQVHCPFCKFVSRDTTDNL